MSKRTKTKKIVKGYEIKGKNVLKRRGKIRKTKYSKRLQAGDPIGAPGSGERAPGPPSEGGLWTIKSKTKHKKGKFKKSLSKVIDKEGLRMTKEKKRVTRKGVLKEKKVVWVDGKRTVTKTRDGVEKGPNFLQRLFKGKNKKVQAAGGKLPSNIDSYNAILKKNNINQ